MELYNNLLEEKSKEHKSDIIFSILVAVLLGILLTVFLLNTYVFGFIEVNKSSMYPNLKDGDVLIMNYKKEYTRGSIVIISGEEENWLIKRVIAIEGDTITFVDGYTYIKKSGEEDFVKIEEDYLSEENEGQTWIENSDLAYPYTLSENEVYYMGDNRIVSLDSRDKMFSTCTGDQIVGVVESWSIRHKEGLKRYKNFSDKMKRIIMVDKV